VIAARELLYERRSPQSLPPLAFLEERAKQLLGRAAARLGLSARATCRIASLALTIAALRGRTTIASEDVAEALQYRPLLGLDSTDNEA